MTFSQPDIQPLNPHLRVPFGRRAGAYFIDAGLNVVLVGVILGVWFVVGLIIEQIASATGAYGLYGVWGLTAIFVYALVFIAYPVTSWYLTATRGYSPGKKILGLRVVDESTGGVLGFGRAALRVLVLSVAGFFCGIVAIVMAVLTAQHPRQQGWHDLAAKSVVVPLDPAGAAPVSPVASASPAMSAPNHASPGYAAPPAFPAPSVPAPTPPPVPPAPSAVEPPQSVAPPIPQAPPIPPAPPAPGLIPPAPGFVPPPPGVPAPPATAGVASEPADLHQATVAGRRLGQPVSWILVAPDGSSTDLDGAVIVGRNPEPSGEFATGVPWRVADADLSMSKSHAAFGVEDGQAWVQDLGSTNGTTIVRDGTEISVDAGMKAPVRDGDAVFLGDVPVQVGVVE